MRGAKRARFECSVINRPGLLQFARGLVELGCLEIISTGGTYEESKDA